MASPKKIRLRTYNVGFGDCFLLTFYYTTTQRHVLIDFGSTSRPEGASGNHMEKVAENIGEACGGKLHAVVATHRHRDHISGFSTKTNGKGTGDIIRSLSPDVVVQPWTEDPDAEEDATAPTEITQQGRAFVGMLDDMNRVAAAVETEMKGWHPASPQMQKLRDQLSFMGENNIKNLNAVKNLMGMSEKRKYVHYGSSSGIVMPGVSIKVLGPPTLEQTESIRSQVHRQREEFWHLLAVAGGQAAASMAAKKRFAKKYFVEQPLDSARWLVGRMDDLRARQLKEIVTILDKAMNNTSVILLFEVGGQKLLFPGDAQWENWEYALKGGHGDDNLALLKDVTLYKVGHHGSLNATPKTLFNNFDHKTTNETEGDRLVSVVSTKAGKHGHKSDGTEVPRTTLVEALKSESHFHTTEDLTSGELFMDRFFVP